MISDFDRLHMGEILADSEHRFNWMTAYTLKFLDKAINKGAVQYYGWPQEEIDTQCKRWSDQAYLQDADLNLPYRR
jgi:hypothetical protein